jgi:hypothetical protein
MGWLKGGLQNSLANSFRLKEQLRTHYQLLLGKGQLHVLAVIEMSVPSVWASVSSCPHLKASGLIIQNHIFTCLLVLKASRS